MAQKMKHAKGERLNIRFNRKIKVDPVMREVTGKSKNAASINTIGRFETEILTLKKNLKGLSKINGRWVEKAMERAAGTDSTTV